MSEKTILICDNKQCKSEVGVVRVALGYFDSNDPYDRNLIAYSADLCQSCANTMLTSLCEAVQDIKEDRTSMLPRLFTKFNLKTTLTNLFQCRKSN